MGEISNHKEYIINLNIVRSRRALVAAITVSFFTFVSVIRAVLSSEYEESPFHYFTILSNILSSCGAMFMLPYAVEGLRRKRFTMPRWISLFQYAGAVSIFITMFCAVTIISITLGPEFAFRGNNLWLHLIVPILAIVLFLAVETNYKLTKKDTLISLIPFWSYGIIYTVMVVIVGEDRGGWSDIYETTSRLPFWIVFIILFVIGYAAAIFLRKIHNLTIDRNMRNFISRWDGLSPVELRVEVFGLGRYMSKHLDKSEIVIPMDIFELMSKNCGVSMEDLTAAYIKGVETGSYEEA